MNKYEQLKQKIHKANPDKFTEDFGVISTTTVNRRGVPIKSTFPDNIFRLADVLLALEEKYQRRIKNSLSININRQYNSNQGDGYEYSLKLAVLKLMKYWDLLEDLDNQSKKTKQFLQDILL